MGLQVAMLELADFWTIFFLLSVLARLKKQKQKQKTYGWRVWPTAAYTCLDPAGQDFLASQIWEKCEFTCYIFSYLVKGWCIMRILASYYLPGILAFLPSVLLCLFGLHITLFCITFQNVRRHTESKYTWTVGQIYTPSACAFGILKN